MAPPDPPRASAGAGPRAGGGKDPDEFEEVDVHDLATLGRLTSARTKDRYTRPPEPEEAM